MWPFLDLDLQIQPCVSAGRNQQQVASHGISSDMPNHLLCFKPPGTYSFMLYRCYCPLLQGSSISSPSVHRSLAGAWLNYVPLQSPVTAMPLSSEAAAIWHILEPLLYVSILGHLKAQLIYISMNRGLQGSSSLLQYYHKCNCCSELAHYSFMEQFNPSWSSWPCSLFLMCFGRFRELCFKKQLVSVWKNAFVWNSIGLNPWLLLSFCRIIFSVLQPHTYVYFKLQDTEIHYLISHWTWFSFELI